MSTLAVVQARMSSTRLPGKTLADVGGEPLLALLLRRLSGARELQGIVVATSTDSEDDSVGDLARGLGCDLHRGPQDDVLARILGAAEGHRGAIVRITGDCPLIDPLVVDEVVRLFGRTPDCAYASNVEPRTFPDGLDVEVVSVAALEKVAEEAVDPADREHVTSAIRRDATRFRATALVCEENLGDLRWTVDTAEDLEFLRAVVARLGDRRHEASMREILDAVRAEPSLAGFHGLRG